MTKKKRLIIIGSIIIFLIAIVYSVYIFVIGRPFYRIEKIKKSEVVRVYFSGSKTNEYKLELYRNEKDMKEFEKARDQILKMRFVPMAKSKRFDYSAYHKSELEGFTITVLTADGKNESYGYSNSSGVYMSVDEKFYKAGRFEKNSIENIAEQNKNGE